MMGKKFMVDEADAFMRQLKFLIAGVVALFVVPLFIYGVYLDRRLDSFEDSLRYRPPQENDIDAEIPISDLYHLAANPVSGQIVYVPAYSHIYHGSGDPYLLTVTLSVRNTSLTDEIVVRSVRYFDTHGKEVKSYLAKPMRVAALGTTEVLVERNDTTGGSGANFLVEWFSANPVTEPIIEAVMIDTDSQQGISFARRGSVISEVAPAADRDTATGSDSKSAAE